MMGNSQSSNQQPPQQPPMFPHLQQLLTQRNQLPQEWKMLMDTVNQLSGQIRTLRNEQQELYTHMDMYHVLALKCLLRVEMLENFLEQNDSTRATFRRPAAPVARQAIHSLRCQVIRMSTRVMDNDFPIRCRCDLSSCSICSLRSRTDRLRRAVGLQPFRMDAAEANEFHEQQQQQQHRQRRHRRVVSSMHAVRTEYEAYQRQELVIADQHQRGLFDSSGYPPRRLGFPTGEGDPERFITESECAICKNDQPPDFYSVCGHQCLCGGCALTIFLQNVGNACCPLCRKKTVIFKYNPHSEHRSRTSMPSTSGSSSSDSSSSDQN